MRRIAIVLLMLAGPAALSAPAPFPKPPKAKPGAVRPFWEVDFSPLAKAGQVNLSIYISLRTGDGRSHQLSVGQGGQVLIAPIIDAFGTHFDKGDVEVDKGKTKMTFKSMKGMQVLSVDLVLKNLDQKFCPKVLPPTKK